MKPKNKNLNKKKNKKNNILNFKINLVKEYKSLFKFLNESKKFMIYSSLIFLISFLIGFLFKLPESINSKLLGIIKEIFNQTKDMSPLQLTSFIIFNNLKSTFFGILLGIFFGIFPFLSLVLNGIILGIVSSLSVTQQGVLSLWKIFPHGIFELPAVFISLGLGLKIGYLTIKSQKKEIMEFLFNSLKIYFLIVFPLIIFAGIIESLLISLLS